MPDQWYADLAAVVAGHVFLLGVAWRMLRYVGEPVVEIEPWVVLGDN